MKKGETMWQELRVELERRGEEIVSNLLIELGAQGVAIEDTADYLDKEDLFGEIVPEKEQSDLITIIAYYPENLAVEDIKIALLARLDEVSDFVDPSTIHLEDQALEEEDWADNWKKYYEPARITHALTIVPSWTDYEATAGEKVIRLDPGMAFGTGTHPTTKMSLFALEQVLRGGERVLDVGTGSGVLSIASSLLGAGEVHAYDLDEVAVRVAEENIALNAHTDNITVKAGDLLRGVELEADVIVANILADILVHLTEDAYRLLKDEGYLIMSGIIATKWEMVRTAAETAGFFLETQMIQGEWNAAIFKKTREVSGVIGG
ncbi:ribosomal protein L11 methyltransferase [Streptococcus acidominimus]|uniref:Ribosomal protein L11 methyltransferase n=2 Tax=Streptococcus acidominimus TaxID=1326 RepID=A0A1Q8EBP7_STRAI|nr:50S ribosomal protein L11 methyltransferase [Streptococcus acidominimus]OLF49226.1 ribosomal protein L11 methyltransferase [Streptococcus acidominimus]